jgi:hypothetical protein
MQIIIVNKETGDVKNKSTRNKYLKYKSKYLKLKSKLQKNIENIYI